jgi:hypothetical protein
MSSHADWKGRTVFLVGGGPSLRDFDFDRLRGLGIVVAINEALRVLPFADAVLSIDTKWWNRRFGLVRSFEGERIAIVPDDYVIRHRRATRLYRVPATGISPLPGAVHTGENSGYAALGLAIMRRAKRIYLLGYDMTEPGHFHHGYTWQTRYGAADYPRWSAMFGTLAVEAAARRIAVINCNPNSAIRCFPFQPLDEVVPHAEVLPRAFPCVTGEPGRLHQDGGAGRVEGADVLSPARQLPRAHLVRRRRMEASSGQ